MKSKTYIGQKLIAFVPILSVRDESSVSIELILDESSNVSLNTQVVEMGGVMNVRVTSEQSINEPYLKFSLRAKEGSQVAVKDYIFLLEVEPEQTIVTSGAYSISGQGNETSGMHYGQQNITSETVANEFLLGPYEWAEKDNIPTQFGAVLDGQSLWRVARRINTAMGVSINQMMWALYVNNPQAFASKSIESLQAGVYLDVPSYSEVSKISDTQAKQSLDRLSVPSVITNDVVNKAAIIKLQSTDEQAESPVHIKTGDIVADDSLISEQAQVESEGNNFMLSSVGDTQELNANDPLAGSKQAIETINSLSVTVGNLTQELIRKDQRIEFLEQKIDALEGVANLDSIERVEATTTLEEQGSSKEQAKVVVAAEAQVRSVSKKPTSSWFLWSIVAGVGLLLLMALAKFFKSKGEGAVDESQVEDSEFSANARPTFSEVIYSKPEDADSLIETASIEKTKKHSVAKPEINKNLHQDEFDDFENVMDDISVDFLDDDVVANVQNDAQMHIKEYQEFEKKLEVYIESLNYNAAAELLDDEHNKVIDDDRYHFERLRLYFEQRDEEGFYAYYYQIESNMKHFAENWNRQISEMVVKFGQKA